MDEACYKVGCQLVEVRSEALGSKIKTSYLEFEKVFVLLGRALEIELDFVKCNVKEFFRLVIK